MKFPTIDYKSTLKLLLKLLFAVGILYWLVSQNKLDYSLVIRSLKSPVLWLSCFILLLFQICLGAVRWRIILKTQMKEISLKEVLRIQWIGQFFSVILPGAVTGDLVKIGYVTALKKNVSKKFLLLTIFIDRLVGLNALLLLAGLTSAIYYRELVELNPLLKGVIYVNIFLFLGSCGIMFVFLLNKKLQLKIMSLVPFKKVNDILEMIWSFSSFKRDMLKAFLISVFAHVVTVGSFWLINLQFFEKSIELKYLLSLIPLGQVAVSIPVSPAGLGIGHAAYDKLFHFIGHSNGASLFNVWWVVMFMANLCGVLPFLFSRSPEVAEVKLKESSP